MKNGHSNKNHFSHLLLHAIVKFRPSHLIHNPVMFLTAVGALITTLELFFSHENLFAFTLNISLWLWATVLFANFSEAFSESRNERYAAALRATRQIAYANLLQGSQLTRVAASLLKKDDLILIKSGETVPSDGEIVEGCASIDESAITGESAPVIRAYGSDQNTVTAGTRLLSDQIKVRITANPGENFLDKMIHLIEGAKRKKTTNELALIIFLSGLSFIFLVVMISLKIFGFFLHIDFPNSMLVAFLVCLIPTTIAGLLSAIGIAGINRLMKENVLAMSGQAIESAGDIDIIMVDKTGTITLGNRHAVAFFPEEGVSEEELAKSSYLSSLEDITPEGKSIVELSLKLFPHFKDLKVQGKFLPFSAASRVSGIEIEGSSLRKGARDAIEKLSFKPPSYFLKHTIEEIAKRGASPLLVSSNGRILGVIHLKDVIKPGIAEQFRKNRLMGQKILMVTGDNALTAQSIAKEAEVSDFIAEATPENKLDYLEKMQKKEFMVAMTGDGVNDAPVLAHADIGVAMNAGTQAAKEASNMIDLDSNPAKIFTIIEVGKQLLMTRGALTTFSIANDVAKYFAILPAMLMPIFPFFRTLNLMNLSTPQTAILSAIIFNALIIVALIPLAIKGVKFVPQKPEVILKRNLLLYGLGGVLLPFIGIKWIDMILSKISFLVL
jgi:potassium-transporting ATPase ATP-binding subunit